MNLKSVKDALKPAEVEYRRAEAQLVGALDVHDENPRIGGIHQADAAVGVEVDAARHAALRQGHADSHQPLGVVGEADAGVQAAEHSGHRVGSCSALHSWAVSVNG